MIPAKTHKVLAIVRKLAKGMVWAIDIIYSTAWNQIFIKLSNKINTGPWAGGEDLALEDPGSEVVAPKHQYGGREGKAGGQTETREG